MLVLLVTALPAQAADNAVERGLNKAGKAVERGAKVAGKAVDRAAQGVQKGAATVHRKVDEKVRPAK
jgi:hypothetical protein